jgi:triacylglycerol lipase
MSAFRFIPTNREFNLVNALGCARLAELAYQDASVCALETSAWGLDRFQALVRGSNFGFVCARRDVVFVVFRGTDDREDWKTNLNVLSGSHAWGSVHGGFLSAAESFWPEIPEVIHGLGHVAQSIWVTGHSLGGALAFLAAVKLFAEHDLPIGGLYTFGQPPVGNARFRVHFEERFPPRYFRFVNHRDAVIDASGLWAGHVGEKKYFDVNGRLWNDPPFRRRLLDAMLAEWRHDRDRDEARAAGRPVAVLAGVEAHGMSYYTSRIEAALAREEGLPGFRGGDVSPAK